MKLVKGIDLYIAYKQASGFRYSEAARRFSRFSRYMGDKDLSNITPEDVTAYLGPPASNPGSGQEDYLRLRKFFDYWTVQGEIKSMEMPPRPFRNHLAARPYVYSLAEIQRLLNATNACQARANCQVDAETLRMYVTVLYATGITTCEVLDLRRGNVDLFRRTITVFNRKYGRSRKIPIGFDLRRLLSLFLRRRSPGSAEGCPLFADKTGKCIKPWQVTYCFSRLRKIAGVGSQDPGSLQPRVLDLRTTFAVHRIRAWINDGTDLNRMLPALATYLGQTGLSALDKYMDLTPEGFTGQLSILCSD